MPTRASAHFTTVLTESPQNQSTLTLCELDSLADGSSRGFELGESSCFAVRNQAGEVFVYANSCPHLGVELEWLPDQFLDADGALIQCATHGALFVIETGLCVSGPCLGQNLRPIPFAVREGKLQIDRSSLDQD